jgi:hypothetical protein
MIRFIPDFFILNEGFTAVFSLSYPLQVSAKVIAFILVRKYEI